MAAPVTNFLEIQFPPEIYENFVGGPAYLTLVDESQETAAEERVSLREIGRGEWTISGGVWDLGRTETVVAFFRIMKGRRYGFRYKDWTDYQISTPQEAEEIDGTHYQIVKRYTLGGQEEVRPIYKPVLGSVEVWNGLAQATGWTVDNATGIVTFSSIPGFVPTVTCQFDVPVRFGVDKLRLQTLNATQRSWPDIPLIELMDDEATP